MHTKLVISKILLGLYLLFQSPSSVFCILCLLALTITTWHLGSTNWGAIAWASFFGIVPGLIIVAEHREQLASMQLSAMPVSSVQDAPGSIFTPPTSPTGLPPNGTL